MTEYVALQTAVHVVTSHKMVPILRLLPKITCDVNNDVVISLENRIS